MKTTARKLNLPDLVVELREQRLLKKDFVLPGNCLNMKGGMLQLFNVNGQNEAVDMLLKSAGLQPTSDGIITLEPSKICHDQLAEKLDIARAYYNRMKEDAIDLLATNVNHWLNTSGDNYLLRTFYDPSDDSGIARAFLSSKYQFIDNFDVLMAALEAVQQSGAELVMQAGDITDSRMYVRFVAPHIEVQAPELLKNYQVPELGNRGDTGVITGFILTNSEVGKGGFQVMPRLVVRACSNGMILADDKFRKMHLGSRMSEYTAINWSNQTIEQEGKLIVSQVKDAVTQFVSKEYLSGAVQKFIDADQQKLTRPIDAMRNVCQELRYTDDKANKILEYFMGSTDYTGFGLGQALTFYAHKDADADEQYDLELVAVEVATSGTKYDREFKPAGKRSK